MTEQNTKSELEDVMMLAGLNNQHMNHIENAITADSRRSIPIRKFTPDEIKRNFVSSETSNTSVPPAQINADAPVSVIDGRVYAPAPATTINSSTLEQINDKLGQLLEIAKNSQKRKYTKKVKTDYDIDEPVL